DPLDLLRRHRLGMREIEAQPVRCHQRALLRHMVAEHLVQRLVQDVRRRMVSPYGAPADMIHFEPEGVSDLERALLHHAGVDKYVGRLLLGIADGEPHAVGATQPAVAHRAPLEALSALWPAWRPDSP